MVNPFPHNYSIRPCMLLPGSMVWTLILFQQRGIRKFSHTPHNGLYNAHCGAGNRSCLVFFRMGYDISMGICSYAVSCDMVLLCMLHSSCLHAIVEPEVKSRLCSNWRFDSFVFWLCCTSRKFTETYCRGII